MSVTTSAGCSWAALTTNNWITFATATNGTGNGVIGYQVAANPNASERVGSIQVEDQFLVLTQRAASCTVALSPSSTNHGTSAGNGTFNVTSAGGCGWTTASTNTWITIITGASGAGNGAVSYSFAANASAVARTGYITATGPSNTLAFTVSQSGVPCTFTLAPANAIHGGGVETGSVAVTTLAGCAWTAISTNPWLTVTSPTNNTGSGTVAYTVAGNPSMTSRTGVVAIAGQNFSIAQAGFTCAYSLSPTNRNHGYGAATNNAVLTTSNGCVWSVVNSSSWITIESAASGSGPTTVTYSVTANSNPVARTGVVVVAGQNLTITQDPVNCSYSLSPKSRAHGSGAGSNSVSISTAAGCSWTASTTNPWITFATATNGTGNGVVGYQVAANPNAFERVGSIQVEDQFLVLTQRAASCSVAIAPASTNHAENAGSGAFNVTVAGGCGWTAATTNTWITIITGASGAGNGAVSYGVVANTTPTPRSGVIAVVGPSNTVSFPITQDGVFVACNYRLSPTNRTHGSSSATNTVSLTVSNTCDWAISNTNSWITILSGANGTGPSTINYAVAANPTVNERTGLVQVADQILTIIQHGVTCDFAISPTNRNHGFSATTNSVELTAPAACAWTISNTNSWIHITSAATGFGDATVDYMVDENTMPLQRTGFVFIASETLTLVQRAAPCLYELTPTNRLHGFGVETGLVAVATSATCDWTATATNSWITITAGASGTGNGSLGYRVAANPAAMIRTGYITVGDETFKVVQSAAPCTFAIAPEGRAHGGGAETGTVTVTSLAGCDWTVNNTNSWIDIQTGTNGTGSEIVTYKVDPNPSLNPRFGTLIIAGESFLVTQAGFTCVFRLSPTNRNHGYGASTGLVSIATSNGCNWVVQNTNSWITISTLTSGSGSGSFGYAVEENMVPVDRTGIIMVSGQPFILRQLAAACMVELSPDNRTHGHGAATGTVNVATATGCIWTTSTTNDWISILSGTNGSGSNVLTYAVTANPAMFDRTGAVMVADQTFTVRQLAAPCLYDLSTTSRTHGYSAATGSVVLTVSTGCPWSIENTNSWVVINSPTNGTGGATISYTVDANPVTYNRTGVVVIAGISLTLRQLSAPCAYVLTPTNVTIGTAAATGLVAIATADNCSWDVSNTNSWIVITTATNGLGDGSFGYSVTENTSPAPRNGYLLIGDELFRVTQAGITCNFVIAPGSRSHGAGEETNSISVTAPVGCVWTVSNSNSWVNILSGSSGSGNGTVSYSLDANPTITPRSGLVIIAGQTFMVNQAGAVCTYRLSPTNRTHGYGLATGTVSIVTLAGCAWNVINTNDWINIASAVNGSGNATITYMVAANTNIVPRVGLVQVVDQFLVVTQQAAPCNFSVSPLTRTHGNGTVSNTISVTTLGGCAWGASTTNDWITLLSPTNFIGSGSISYMAMTNIATFWRTGYIVVADQVVTLAQRPTPCTYLLSPSNAVHGAGIEAGIVSVTAPATCVWTVANTNPWISLTTGTNGSGTGGFEYEVDANPTVFSRTGLVFVADQVLSIEQAGTACTFAIAPSGHSHGAGMETGSVTVTTLNGCNWAVSNSNSWITIASGASGSSNGFVSYVVATNPVAIARSGVITIAGYSFTISQAAAICTYALTPGSRSHSASADTGIVAVATLAGCNWTATTTNTWITITAGASGSGNGNVTYTVAANPIAVPRTGYLAVGGQTFTITQSGASCSFSIAPAGRSHGAGGETGLVTVTTITGCAWAVSNANSWITINTGASGSGAGTVGYTVASNTTAIARTGAVSVAGQTFTVTQSGAACSFSLAPANRTHSANAETGTVSVTTLVGCAWAVNNTNSWIAVTSGTNGSGSGTVTYTVDINPGSQPRSGFIDIDGQQFSVTQLGMACSFSLTATAWTHQIGGGTGMVTVSTLAGCGWTAVNTNSWITITSGGSGNGGGTVTYTVASHSGVTDRLGVMTIAGQNFTVSQLGSGCTYRISPTNRFHGNGAATNTFTMTASNGCAWVVVNPNSWITILSNASGSGNAVIGYAITNNRTATQRVGLLNIGGEIMTITQWGTNCGLALTPVSRAHGSGSETGLVTISASATNCAWSIVNTNPWITINTPAGGSGTGASNFGYTVSANATTSPRSGVITVAGETFNLTQSGLPCTYAISPTNRAHGSVQETGSVAVTAAAGCAWSVINNNDWITITSGGSGSGNGTVNYSVAVNPAGLPRTGFLVIGGTTFTISQSGAACVFTLTPTNRGHSAGAETGLVSVAAISGCGWIVVNTNNWITLTATTNGTSTGSVAYAVAANATALVRSGSLVIGGQSFTVTQTGQACTFAISPTNRAHGAGLETGTVNVASVTGCAWTASSTNSWITILSGTNGSGSATVSYSVAVNSSTASRTGMVVVAGQNFVVTQTGANCTFALVPTSRAHGSGVETGSVGVATPAGCTWAVVNPNGWITITAGASGTGGGSVGYSLAANSGSTTRTGALTIAGQTFTITQAGLICSYVLTPAGAAHAAAAGPGSFSVSASTGCAWSVVNTNGWITINSGVSGNGNGTVSYSVTTNSGLPRVGNLVVGGQVFAVSQGSALRLLRAIGMNVTPGQTNKILLALDAQGNENGIGCSLCYDTNRLYYIRTVRGNEATNAGASPPNVNIGSTNRGRLGIGFALNFGEVFPAGSNTFVEVFFRAVSNAPAGPTTVSLCDLPIAREVVDAEATAVTAGYVDAVVNIAGSCTYGLASNAVSFADNGGASSVGVTAGVGCAWSVSNTNTWIGITAGASGSGDGAVAFSVSPNPNIAARSGVLVIAGLNFTVTQSGVSCSYVVVPSQQTHGSGVEGGSINLTTLGGCTWSVSNPNGWITVTSATNGTGSLAINYSVAANGSSFARTGLVTVAGQTYTVIQSGAPCTYAVNPPSRLHAVNSETGLVTVTTVMGCPWTADTADSWITFTTGASGVGSGSFGYRVALNPEFLGRTGTVTVAGQTYTVTQPGNSCAVTLTPASLNHTSGSDTGLVSVVASNGCTWTVGNTNSWITITSSTNGTGSNTVRYTIAANPLGAARTGVVLIGGKPFTASQAGAACVFAIAPMERAHSYGADSGMVSVATFAGCGWQVRNTNNWITVTSPTNLVGGGAVSYNVGANPSGFSRTGVVLIADQVFTVTQSGAPCNYILSPSSRHHGYLAETGSVSLATVFGCGWTVVNTNGWITILSETSGAGPWGVTYAVAANPAGLARTGIVSVAGQALTLSQAAAPCTFSISPTNRLHGYGAATGTVSVTTLAGCAWSVSNTNGWITILSATDNTGPGAVLYAVEENPTSFGRTGVVTIAGQRLTLGQSGAPCTYSVSPTNRTHGYGATTNVLTLASVPGCPWTVSNTNGWITILSAIGGTGSGTITYAVSSNVSSFARSGVVTVAGQSVALAQDGAPCVFTIVPQIDVHTAAAQTGLVNVLTAEGCTWTVNNTNAWILITTSTNGVGSGSFGYLISSNTSPVERTGLVQIASQTFTVSQAGFLCEFTLSPTNGSLTSGNVTGLVSVITSPQCNWVIVNTNSWIAIKSPATLSGTGPNLVRYTGAANPNPSLRTGNLVIGGVPFMVTQLGSPCTYSLSPTNRLHGSGVETSMVSVLTVSECSWSIINTNPWITILSATNSSGNGIVNYFVDANPSSKDRTGLVSIAGQILPITQLGAACLYSFTTNGASYGPAPTTGSVSVTATLNCPWTIVNTNTWITITSGANGTNNGIVNYSVAANVNPLDRSGNLRVGASLYSITQTGIVCTFSLSATNFSHGSGSETGAVSVLTSNLCPWTVSNTNAWITILSSTNSTGPAAVSYSVTANASPIARSGSFVVAGQTYSITQAGFICAFAINPAVRTHSFGAVTGLVSVTTSNLCSWSLQSTNNWITFLGNANRTNGGFVSYVVAANPGITTRTGTVSIAGQPFTITQFGMAFVLASNKTMTCGTPWAFDPPTASGTCADTNLILNILSTITNSNCGSAYTATRRWDAQDTCGNRLTVTQTVNVIVVGPPVVNCASFKVVECGPTWTFDTPTATDSCGGLGVTVQVTGTVTNSSGPCGGAFTATRTWLVTDGCSNQASCSQTVQAIDTTPPTIACAANKSVECGVAWSFDAPTVSDACGGTNVTLRVVSTTTNMTGLCGGSFTATRVWEASDACTNKSSCSQTVTVVDTTPPALSCPGTKTVECGLAWNFDQPIAIDTCAGTNVTVRVLTTVTNAAGACGNTFTAIRTWEALDSCSNRSTCAQMVMVVDTMPPTIICPANKTAEIGSAWTFNTPTASDGCGTNISFRVLGDVTNFAGFCGGTYGITRSWEALDGCSNRSSTCSQTVQLLDTAPPVITCPANKLVACGSGWAFDAPTASDAVSGTNVTIIIVSTVTNGTCASGFSATRTWQAIDACSNRSAMCSQIVSAASQASIAGTIFYHPTNYPAVTPTTKRLTPVPLNVTGSTNLATQTASDGSYSFTVNAAGTYDVTPRLTNSSPAANGVSTIDISLIRRHILNIAPLDTPYKLLAADVNGSRTVTTLDLTFIRRLILGSTNALPTGLWRFVPADYAFTNMASPWDAPTNRSYANLVTGITNQDFMAIKIGDVNNSWAPPVSLTGFAPAAQRNALANFGSEVTFTVSGHTNQPGEMVAVQVTASNFRDVTSAQWTLAWDPAVLRFAGTGQYGLKGLTAANFGSELTNAGRLTFSWDDPDAAGVTRTDGTAVFTANFMVTGVAGSVSPLSLSSAVTEAEVGVKFSEGLFRSVNGYVTVIGPADEPPAQPQLTRAVHVNGVFGVPQQTIAGRRYILEYTDSLPAKNWTPLPAVIGDGSVMILEDPGATSAQRFYRLRIE